MIAEFKLFVKNTKNMGGNCYFWRGCHVRFLLRECGGGVLEGVSCSFFLLKECKGRGWRVVSRAPALKFFKVPT